MKRLLILSLVISSVPAWAVKVQFPEDELARESVYPVFDRPEAVKRRAVETAKKIEFAAVAGWSISDALWDPFTYGLGLSYHFTEEHGVHLLGTMFSAKSSQYVPQLEADNIGLRNLASSPRPNWIFLANYQITPFYGKISITKQTVFNLSILATAGLGTVNINGENTTAWSVGLGQKLYFNPKWGVRFDLRAVTYQAPNAFSYRSLPADTTPPNSEFEKQTFTNTMITGGLVYLL